MSQLEEKFKENLEAWREHCIQKVNSSNPNDDLECDAYRNIVAMGKEALPLIREAYDLNQHSSIRLLEMNLHHAVQEILGDDFKVPEDIRYNLDKIMQYTPKWLDENMDKYIGK